MPSKKTSLVSLRRPSLLFTSVLLVGLSAAGVYGLVQEQDSEQLVEVSSESTQSLEGWKSGVWAAAKSGDTEGLALRLQSIPESADPMLASELRDSVEAWKSHLIEAEGDRTEDRAEAFSEMSELLAEAKLVEALNAAIKVQTLSDDLAELLTEERIIELLRQSEEQLVVAQKDGDWLLAQDLLYRLRTLHEDTGDVELYKRYDDELDAVNRRISLLAQYAQRTLHELRRQEMKRYAPETEFPEYNEAFADEWKERLRDINDRMLKRALIMTSRDHIAGAGWKPLLEGGLEALRIFVTTKALTENFSDLGSEEQVARFDEFLEIHEKRISDMSEEDINSETCRRLIDEVVLANNRTVQVPSEVIIREFGDGAMYRLEKDYQDEYSQVIWPDEIRRFQQQVNGAFVGVGILIRHDDRRQVVIVNPLEGSPAARSGVKAGDIIFGVEGKGTVGWSLNRAVDEITGPVGEDVMLTIKREGVDDPFDLAITRDQIKMRSVNGWWKKEIDSEGEPTWDWYIDEKAGIGYVRLTSFNDDSFDDFLAALEEMHAVRPMNGLILDLRYNPGGLLRSAVEFSNLFVDEGVIVSGEDRTRKTVWELPAQPGMAALKGLPTVILVNQGSASASEIVAGALQAHDSALILGERSFGKGSVQTVHQLAMPFSQQAAVKLTTQYYVLPPVDGERGRLVHKKAGSTDWGVNPHLVVSMNPEQIVSSVELRQKADLIEEWLDDSERAPRPEVEALITEGTDPQLERALLILKAQTLQDRSRQQIASEQKGL
jgi:carboxyl-terminal processing protease